MKSIVKMRLDKHPRITTPLVIAFFFAVGGMAVWLAIAGLRVLFDIVTGLTPMTWGEAGVGAIVAIACIVVASLAGYGLRLLSRLINWRFLLRH